MNIDIVKNLNLDKKDQVKFVNFAKLVMRVFKTTCSLFVVKKQKRNKLKGISRVKKD